MFFELGETVAAVLSVFTSKVTVYSVGASASHCAVKVVSRSSLYRLFGLSSSLLPVLSSNQPVNLKLDLLNMEYGSAISVPLS